MQKKRFLACGNVITDQVIDFYGTVGPKRMGGPSVFALSGMRLWDDACKLVAGVGEDALDTYGKWLENNNLTNDSLHVVCECGTSHVLKYLNETGTKKEGGFTARLARENFGYMKTRPEWIDEACVGEGIQAVYLAQNVDRVFWRQLLEVKRKHGFRFMWELEFGGLSNVDDQRTLYQRVMDVIQGADMWSVNMAEAESIFGIPQDRDEQIVREIMKMPVEFTLYRVGQRGAFAVTPTQAYFCPAIDVGPYVDQTGCGNCSTGAAMAGYSLGYDLKTVLVMANVAAGYNCLQWGVIPEFTTEQREEAWRIVRANMGKVEKLF